MGLGRGMPSHYRRPGQIKDIQRVIVFLTADEIAELTDKKQRAAQRIVLNAIDIQYKIRPDGSLIVSRAHVEKEFGAAAVQKAKKRAEPNWEAMENA